MKADAKPRFVVLTSAMETPCAVEAGARLMAWGAGGRAAVHALTSDMGALRRALADADALVAPLPAVAWKKRFIAPVAAMALARAMGKRVVLVLHEWGDLDPRRRASYAPMIPLASAILFSSPEVRDQFAESPLSRIAVARRAIVPIPPNLFRPDVARETDLSRRLKAERAAGRLVIGHFGSIYPKKQSTIVLDVAAALRDRGHDPFVAFIGSFIKGSDRLEEVFAERIKALDLGERVAISGFVHGTEDVFGLFDAVDVFVYCFPEGLSSRRSSVLATASAGRPVVVNAPARVDGFDHHPTYRALFANGMIRLASHGADATELANAVIASRAVPAQPTPVNKAEVWGDLVEVVDRAIRA